MIVVHPLDAPFVRLLFSSGSRVEFDVVWREWERTRQQYREGADPRKLLKHAQEFCKRIQGERR